jgi:hypothetical protein
MLDVRRSTRELLTRDRANVAVHFRQVRRKSLGSIEITAARAAGVEQRYELIAHMLCI